MPFSEQSDPCSGEQPGKPVAPVERTHDEHCVRYSHAMPYDLQESIGRFVIRIVPLIYAGMFGALMDEMRMALTVGVLVSAGMDLAMGNQSILRNIGRRMIAGGCPVLAGIARGLAGGLNAIGIRTPASLSNRRCGFS